ncbi:hypothetical protein BN938_1884 [Mucinivorans hirudinis]|uniref:HTH cro/C1-type domain-containing protein n=1 Tax=Mucinivorans hirudinis TaxID=1433126 RepID=A0A060RDM8_9BACT|nr:hypothetical protein BN938_1884 [Mucinivorans hirudinis]
MYIIFVFIIFTSLLVGANLAIKVEFYKIIPKTMKSAIEQYVIDKVRRIRIERGMSQADLAFSMGLSYGFIGKVESANLPAKYNINHINKLAEVLNVSPKDFFPEKPL